MLLCQIISLPLSKSLLRYIILQGGRASYLAWNVIICPCDGDTMLVW